jgi:hemin uptake protein HemP
MTTEDRSSTANVPTRRPQGVPPRVIKSEELMAGERELRIQHQHATYLLRVTGSNKLILTK